MEVKKVTQNGFIYNQISKAAAFVVSIMIVVFLTSTPLKADAFDTDFSGLSFGSLSNFAAGLAGDLKAAFDNGVNEVNIANNKKDERGKVVDTLQILHIGFNGYYSESDLNTNGVSLLGEEDDRDIVAEVIGEALVYPNPFRVQSGVAKLGYRLSKDMDIQIQIYDMMANMILKRTFFAGVAGAKKGYNKLRIDNEVFEGEPLSSGVYFYLLIHDGKVIARGKMAVKP